MSLPRMLRTLDLPGIMVHSLNWKGETGVVHQLQSSLGYMASTRLVR